MVILLLFGQALSLITGSITHVLPYTPANAGFTFLCTLCDTHMTSDNTSFGKRYVDWDYKTRVLSDGTTERYVHRYGFSVGIHNTVAYQRGVCRGAY